MKKFFVMFVMVLGVFAMFTSAFAANADIENEYQQYGRNACLTGEVPENVAWNDELQEYFNRGFKETHDSGVLQAIWEESGYRFVSQGEVLVAMDERFMGEQLEYIQRDVSKALAKGDVVSPEEIKPLDSSNPTGEQVCLEALRQILSEGWFEFGQESVGDLHFFDDHPVSSVLDEFFSSRGLGAISASSLVNAGRV